MLTSMEVPVVISGPMIKHGGRFEAGLDEREEVSGAGGRAGNRAAKRADATPSSAESEEQWPGVY